MTKPYRAFGKQVQRNREHVADAADATWAQIITDALNGERTYAGMPLHVDPSMPPNEIHFEHANGMVDKIINLDGCVTHNQAMRLARRRRHVAVMQPDGSYRCGYCTRTWDRDEGDECPGAS